MLKQLSIPLILIVSFFLVLFVFTKIFGPIPFLVNSINTNKSDAFYVNGEGRSSQKPDMFVVSLGVTSTGTTVKLAQDDINSKVNKVSEVIKNLGVLAEDIQTQDFSIRPNYDIQSGTQKIVNYSANTTLMVKVKQIDKVNEVIDLATANGANQVGGINFDISDKTKAQNEAREKAVNDAKAKAKQAEKVVGFRLGRIINYSESFNEPPVAYGTAVSAIGGREDATRIEPGINEVVVTVTLSYEII